MFRRKRQSNALTGARATLKALHRDQVTGQVHGHEWEITVWWRYSGANAEVHKSCLDRFIEHWEGKCLPDSIAWAERLAPYVAHSLDTEFGAWGPCSNPCAKVEIARHEEGLFARWEA